MPDENQVISMRIKIDDQDVAAQGETAQKKLNASMQNTARQAARKRSSSTTDDGTRLPSQARERPYRPRRDSPGGAARALIENIPALRKAIGDQQSPAAGNAIGALVNAISNRSVLLHRITRASLALSAVSQLFEARAQQLKVTAPPPRSPVTRQQRPFSPIDDVRDRADRVFKNWKWSQRDKEPDLREKLGPLPLFDKDRAKSPTRPEPEKTTPAVIDSNRSGLFGDGPEDAATTRRRPQRPDGREGRNREAGSELDAESPVDTSARFGRLFERAESASIRNAAQQSGKVGKFIENLLGNRAGAAAGGVEGSASSFVANVLGRARVGPALGQAGASASSAGAGGAGGIIGRVGGMFAGGGGGAAGAGGGAIAGAQGVGSAIATLGPMVAMGAGVLVTIRNAYKFVEESVGGIKKIVSGTISGDPSAFAHGGVAVAQAGGRAIGTGAGAIVGGLIGGPPGALIGGAIMGEVTSRLIGVLNPIISQLDVFEHTLAKFNPMLSAAEMRLDLETKLFNMQLSERLRPMLTQWISLKGKFLDVMSNIVASPIVGKITGYATGFLKGIGKFIDGILWVTNIVEKVVGVGVSLVKWIADITGVSAVLSVVFKGISWAAKEVIGGLSWLKKTLKESALSLVKMLQNFADRIPGLGDVSNALGSLADAIDPKKSGSGSDLTDAADRWKAGWINALTGSAPPAAQGQNKNTNSATGRADPDRLPAVPHRAGGGVLLSNQPSVVGEHGPEVFVPARSGTVIRNGDTTTLLRMGITPSGSLKDSFSAKSGAETKNTDRLGGRNMRLTLRSIVSGLRPGDTRTSSIVRSYMAKPSAAGPSWLPKAASGPIARRDTAITRLLHISMTLPHRAGGGVVLSNNMYFVGENGQEVFAPQAGQKRKSDDTTLRNMGLLPRPNLDSSWYIKNQSRKNEYAATDSAKKPQSGFDSASEHHDVTHWMWKRNGGLAVAGLQPDDDVPHGTIRYRDPMTSKLVTQYTKVSNADYRQNGVDYVAYPQGSLALPGDRPMTEEDERKPRYIDIPNNINKLPTLHPRPIGRISWKDETGKSFIRDTKPEYTKPESVTQASAGLRINAASMHGGSAMAGDYRPSDGGKPADRRQPSTQSAAPADPQSTPSVPGTPTAISSKIAAPPTAVNTTNNFKIECTSEAEIEELINQVRRHLLHEMNRVKDDTMLMAAMLDGQSVADLM